MAEDNGELSRDALAYANEISEIAIFWGLIIAIVVVVIGMMKGLFG